MFGIFKKKAEKKRVCKVLESEYKEYLDKADSAAKALIARSRRVFVNEES